MKLTSCRQSSDLGFCSSRRTPETFSNTSSGKGRSLSSVSSTDGIYNGSSTWQLKFSKYGVRQVRHQKGRFQMSHQWKYWSHLKEQMSWDCQAGERKWRKWRKGHGLRFRKWVLVGKNGRKPKLFSVQHRTLAVSQRRKIIAPAEFTGRKYTSRRRYCWQWRSVLEAVTERQKELQVNAGAIRWLRAWKSDSTFCGCGGREQLVCKG